ncbi:uncharacterized protein N0V89_001727 [Didymosphaeria variabile]|uniref:Mid2 domain-containing protein n=1 Tax=Didymosphaeria variabile TaxID=1932322 RepID=A0A9W8XTF3_9PLEO|nr:uncharacterized protein N0V89_001727 [Didymosphaeria variabile]KAJ4357152.1 hypothetical protein N0V89_001727 [Didymosphaeria variabile]
MTPAGAEGITQCSNHDNKWCCDGDRTAVDCCQEKPEPRPFFALQDPVAYGTAGGKTGSSAPNLASITGKAIASGDDSSSTAASNSASATSDSSSSDSSASSTPASTPSTSLSTTVSSGTAGPTTIVTTIVQSAASSTPTASPSATPSKKSNIGLIVGCAVGVPLALALVGILFWLLRKRSHQKNATAHPYTSSTDAFTPTPATPEFAGGAKLHKPNSAAKYASTAPGVPELGGGQGVGPERPVSMIPGKAEMDSGGGFAPGTVPLAPHLVGVGGGNTAHSHGGGQHTPQSSWGSAPPGYSPGQSHAPLAPAGNVDPMAGQYQAYRPGVNRVPEMAELPSVRTPPEAVEMGVPTPHAVGGGAGARAEYPGMAEAARR